MSRPPALALLAAAALAAGAPGVGRAQRVAESFAAFDAGGEGGVDHAVRATFGLDPAIAVGGGYVAAIPVRVAGVERRLALHADVATIPGFTSWDLNAGASVPLAEGDGPNVLATAAIDLKWARNEVHRAAVFGYGVAARPGWYTPTWFVAAELGLRHAVGAHLAHSDAYRAQFAGARDGAVALHTVHLDVGAAVGFRIAERVLVGLRFAWRFHGTLETYDPYVLPYGGGFEVGARF